MIEPYGVDRGSPLHSSFFNLDYTYHYDKLSCVRGAYFVHLTLACLVAVCGTACLVLRALPRFMWLHPHFGRGYIVCMLWLMATSLLMHNTGLPIAVLLSFVSVLGGLTLGWACIVWHRSRTEV